LTGALTYGDDMSRALGVPAEPSDALHQLPVRTAPGPYVPATGPAAAGADAEPAGVPQSPSARQAAERVVELWRRMGWPVAGAAAAGPGGAAAQVVLTPACGMAGAAPGYPREAMARCREAARLLPELMEEGKG